MSDEVDSARISRQITTDLAAALGSQIDRVFTLTLMLGECL